MPSHANRVSVTSVIFIRGVPQVPVPGCSPKQLVRFLFYDRAQRLETLFEHIPHQLSVNKVVVVTMDIAHAGEGTPVGVRMAFRRSSGRPQDASEMISGGALDRVPRFEVVNAIVERALSDKRPNRRDVVQDVLKSLRRVPRRH
jgi:hypothetical protein